MNDLFEYTKDLLWSRLHVIPTFERLYQHIGFRIQWVNNEINVTVPLNDDYFLIFYKNRYIGNMSYKVDKNQLYDTITLIINQIEPYKML